MAFVINDRVKKQQQPREQELSLLVVQFKDLKHLVQALVIIIPYYAIFNPGTSEFEVGLGTLDADSSDLARTTVISSSNSDNAVNFSAGTKDIFCTMPASKAVIEDANNDVSIGNHLTIGSQLRMPDNTSGKILVGDGTSYQEVAVSGDATLASDGALTISGGVSQGFVIAMSVAL